MISVSDFSQVVQRDKKTYIRDTYTAGRAEIQVSQMQAVIDDCQKFLHSGKFPESLEDILEVLDEGREGLLVIIWNRADRQAKRLEVQSYVVETWREQERAAVTPEQWAKADDLFHRYHQAQDGLPKILYEEITETDGHFVINREAILGRVEKAITVEVSDEMKADLEALLELAEKARAMELRGINALELIGKYARAKERPEDIQLYRDIVFRRHAVGTVYSSDLARIINSQVK